MLSNPREGQAVFLHYAWAKQPMCRLHGLQGRVVICGRGRPRNHAVEVGGDLYIVPAGQLHPFPGRLSFGRSSGSASEKG